MSAEVNVAKTALAGERTALLRKAQCNGFTILEMSTVIGIIALIAGGIMVGQTMIRNSQLQAVISDLAKYTQAVQSFHDKYWALPGDFTGAEALWGTASGGCPNGTGTGTQTCNGNGNGYLEGDWSGVEYEDYRGWQHLSNAGMIDGYYTGVRDPVHGHVPGVNVPASKLPNSGFNWNSTNTATYPPSINVPSELYLEFGGIAPWGPDDLEGPTLTTQEAYALDMKMDDGLPLTGTVTTFHPSSGYNVNCATTDNAATSQYNISFSGIACNFFIQTHIQ